MFYQGKNYNTYAELQDARNGLEPKAAPVAAPGGGKGPTAAQAPTMAPAPFMPEQAPPMLPMQGQPMQFPMPSKGMAQGPAMQQQPMQQGMPTQNFGSSKPVDLQALIASLMQNGLLGGL